MNSIIKQNDTAECIRCLEKDVMLLLDNFKKFPGIKSLTSDSKAYLFHKIHYFPICTPCIIQLCNRNFIKNTEVHRDFSMNLIRIENNKMKLRKEVKEFKKILREEIIEFKKSNVLE
jgi:hypothetical protein